MFLATVPIIRRNNCIYVTLGTCYSVWMTVWYAGWNEMQFYSPLHTRQSSTQNNKYHMWHKCSCFSWWWAHSCRKHVEKRNKHIKKNCAPSWLYLQDYAGMHGQQNIKMLGIYCSSSHKIFCCLLSQEQQTAPLQHLLLICGVHCRDGVYCSQVLYDIVQQDDDFWCV